MSVKKNYLYNIMYQVITIIIPLITVPYVSRTLGSSGVGLNAFANSLVQYFVLIGTLGTSLYGNRTVAYVREDKNKLSSVFWSIFILRLVMTAVALAAFLFFIFLTGKNNVVYWLQAIYILAAAIDISWLFMGLEDFKKTVIRNMAVKLVSVALIFAIVRSKEDLGLYVLILALSQFFGQLTMWPYLKKVVNKISQTKLNLGSHVLPSLQLFIPQVAIQVYVILNKTMLGFFADYSEVGFFDSADKLVRIILSVVTALGVVMLPRISHTFSKGNLKQVNEYVYKSFNFVSYLSAPLCFGLAAIAKTFTPIYFGPSFEKTGTIIMIISPVIIFIAWSNVLGQQYLLPTGKNTEYTLSVVCGAIINFIVNLLLVRNFTSIGVSIGTIVAEFSVTSVQLFQIRHQISIKKLFEGVWRYILVGLIMFALVFSIGEYLGSSLKTILIQVVVGVCTYFGLLLLFKEETNKKILTEALGLIGVKTSK